jgi:hypothetical protein
MESRDLLIGNKELLLAEFHQLYKIHGKRWRAKLKAISDWHRTDTGYHSWQNAMKGTVGNEPLRLIVADMNTVINAQPAETVIRKQALVRSEPPTLQDKYPAAHRAERKRASNLKANK